MLKENQLILTIGLPYSGKSTWARNQGIPIVNPDCVRLATHGQRFVPQAEDLIWAMLKVMCRSLFYAGHNTVIVDACSTHHKRREALYDPMWKRSYVVMDVAAQVCRDRAKLAKDTEILPIIDRMDTNFEMVEVYYGDKWQPDSKGMEAFMKFPGRNESQIYHAGVSAD